MATTNQESFSKSNGAAMDYKSKPLNHDDSSDKAFRGLDKQIESMTAKTASTVMDYVDTSRDYIKQNPIKGVAIAASAGLLLGGLLTLVRRGRGE
jgi:ElaB/YqjD/DUF883 family membrane-anchored ribosome-binding protein